MDYETIRKRSSEHSNKSKEGDEFMFVSFDEKSINDFHTNHNL
jgi:hypothetical protein